MFLLPFWANVCAYGKNYESYYQFFSTLVKLEPRIVDIIAVGTDGETAVVQALKATLHGDTIYFHCLRTNVS